MVDELRRLRLEEAGLGDVAKIVVDRRPPAGFDHVEPDRTREADLQVRRSNRVLWFSAVIQQTRIT